MLRKSAVLFLLALLLLHCNRDSSSTGPSTVTIDKSDLAQYTHGLINGYRQSKGLPSLTFNATIANIALAHSRNMAAGAVDFGHDGFNDRAADIAKSFKVRSVAENVAWNMGYEDPAATAVDGWLKSPGHHENIVGDYNVTGIGVAVNDNGEYFFTQLFAKTY